YAKGDPVVSRVLDDPATPPVPSQSTAVPMHEGKLLISGFSAQQDLLQNNGASPPNYPPGSNVDWSSTGAAGAGAGDLDFVPDTDFQTLPPGVGCQLINDAKQPTALNCDRYVRTGIILFDSQGRLQSSD